MKRDETVASLVVRECRNVSTAYGSVVQLFDSGDAASSALVAFRLMTRFSKLLDSIRETNEHNKAYINMLIGNQMPEFADDLIFLASLEKSRSLLNDDVKTLKATIYRLERFIEILNKEVRHIFPEEFGVVRFVSVFWKNYQKPVLAISIPVIVFCGIYFPLRAAHIKKYSLKAEYFDDMTLAHVLKTTHDRSVDFSWGYGAPFAGFKMDQFSVQWTGFILIEKTGTVEFGTESDDGVVLFVDDKKVIENWTNHPHQKDFGSIILTAGYHPIKLQYYEFNANAEIHLLWKPESAKSFVVIPSAALLSDEKYVPSL